MLQFLIWLQFRFQKAFIRSIKKCDWTPGNTADSVILCLLLSPLMTRPLMFCTSP